MKNILLVTIILLSSKVLFAHGEDKNGPHGGFVRMPGAFHTELVVDGKSKFKVYLLDIDWKNPSVVKADVQATYKNSKKISYKATCQIQNNFYTCDFPQKVNLKQKGELVIMAQREEQKGMEVSYKLPLKLEKSTSQGAPSEHSMHH